jgi:hypothetical protein
MEAVCSSETSVDLHQTKRRYIYQKTELFETYLIVSCVTYNRFSFVEFKLPLTGDIKLRKNISDVLTTDQFIQKDNGKTYE